MSRIATILTKLGIEFHRKKGAGSFRLWASCPYHVKTEAERKAMHGMRWMMREDGERAGQHHCYSCKNGGTLADLVMHVRGVEYGGALEWLNDFGTPPEPEPLPETIRLDVGPITMRAFRLPREVILEPLHTWVTPARKFAYSRGLTQEQVERWRIGYAVDGRLNGRIVLPVHTEHARLASYMARTFADQTRRYLYPRNDEAPDLDVMFGQRHWEGRERVVVTEGALNALAVERAVATNVASLGGSDIRPMHVARLATFEQVVILTDSDKAGDIAAEELHAALTRHTNVVRVRLPEGPDANELSTAELKRCLVQHLPSFAR